RAMKILRYTPLRLITDGKDEMSTSSSIERRWQPGLFLAVACALWCIMLLSPAFAHAAEIQSFDLEITETQAGAHSDVTTTFEFATETVVPGNGLFNPCFTPDGSCLAIKGGAAKD